MQWTSKGEERSRAGAKDLRLVPCWHVGTGKSACATEKTKNARTREPSICGCAALLCWRRHFVPLGKLKPTLLDA
jgi:hypothetical protein